MFSYCGNNPISRADNGGQLWNFIIGGIVGGVVSAVTTALTTENASWTEIAVAGVVGAIGGAVAASGLNALVQAGITAAVTFVGDVTTQVACEGKSLVGENSVDYGKAAWNSGVAAVSSVIGSVYGSITSSGYKAVGDDMINAGTNKLLTGYVRQSVGQSHSKLISQGRKLIEAGTKLVNTGKGVSSVTGTLLTFGFASKYSV